MFDIDRRFEYNIYIKFILLAKQWKRCDAKLKGLKIKIWQPVAIIQASDWFGGPSGVLFFYSKTVPAELC